MRVPLFQISNELPSAPEAGKTHGGLKQVSEIELPLEKDIPENSYAIKIDEGAMVPVLKKDAIAVFAPLGEPGKAIRNVFIVGIQNQPPLVRMVVKNEAGMDPANFLKSATGSSTSYINKRRKSFMTPTPLHIPGSRISPIPGSAHEMVYLKSLWPERLSVIPVKEVLWMHPLIYIHPTQS